MTLRSRARAFQVLVTPCIFAALAFGCSGVEFIAEGSSEDGAGAGSGGGGGGGGVSGAGAGATGGSGDSGEAGEMAGGAAGSGTGAAGSGGTGPGGTGGAAGGSHGPLDDSFDCDGPLVGYVTNNEASLPDVTCTEGRYHANLTTNEGNVTAHYDEFQGRLDAKLLAFPFDVVARNVGIGTTENSQTAPVPETDRFNLAGLQVHVADLESRNSQHIVVGHAGSTHYTVEVKSTRDGTSTVNNEGGDSAPAGRADVRIVGHENRTLTFYWQPPNTAPLTMPDDWRLYDRTGDAPGTQPEFGGSVYVGLITYAWEHNGVPFVGTCDALEDRSQ